ncbi:hypothetical protein ACHZ98_35075, partial [Streptomyces sp. MAR4 CNY-716]
MARRPTHRRPASDPIGLAPVQMSGTDQVVIVATAVIGLTDRAVVRLVPHAGWRHPDGPRHLNPRRRIENAFKRLKA